MSQAAAAVAPEPVAINTPATGGITGKGFMPGKSGNPAGRSKGIAAKARELIGNDPGRLLNVFLDIAEDSEAKPGDRVAAAREYLDRAYGKAPAYTPVEGDPLDLADPLDHRITAVLDDLATRRETRAPRPSPATPVEATSPAGAATA